MKIVARRLRELSAPKDIGDISRYVFSVIRKSPAGAKTTGRVVAGAVLQVVADHLAQVRGLEMSHLPFIDVALAESERRQAVGLLKAAELSLVPFRSEFQCSEDLGKSWESLYAFVNGDGEDATHESSAKRDHGVYYTPKHLATFLTEKTLNSVLNQCGSAAEIIGLRIVDPAVGAGFFLIAAHRYLLDRAREHLDSRKLKNLSSDIARRCLYGVDRDSFAASVARVALWLEVGDPRLKLSELSNIRAGDALVSVHGSSTSGLVILKELKAQGFKAFEWRAAFPEVFQRENRSGFDVVLSNPPWGKIKADAREYFARLHPEVSTLQGAIRKRFLASRVVSSKHRENYTSTAETLGKYVELLRNTPTYKLAFGVSTDIDYYTLFVQRSGELVHRHGRLGLLIPGAFVRSAGTALIRRQFFQNGETEHLLEFENRERLFPIHGMFKFLLWTFTQGGKPGIRKAVFGLRAVEEARSENLHQTRSISFSSAFLMRTSREWFSVPELYDERQKKLFEKLHKSHPALGEQTQTWNVHFTREMDMTNDSESFIDASARPARDETELLPLYEGRMVNQFDCAAKAYLSGHGRQAKWEVMGFDEKVIRPHYYVTDDALTLRKPRAGFCDITGNANERTVLAALIPGNAVCGNKVPVCEFDSDDLRLHLLWIALANSFVIDWIVRRRISTTLNFFHWKQIPFPRLEPGSNLGRRLWLAAAQLSVIGSPKSHINKAVVKLLSSEGVKPKHLSLMDRARLRAEIDANVASLFGLDAEEFGYLLSDFNTLDRFQPIPKDIKKAKSAVRTITRDFALRHFCEAHKEDTRSFRVAWNNNEPVDLSNRVDDALSAGCIPYLSSQLAAKMFR
jgi:hypothetical protein